MTIAAEPALKTYNLWIDGKDVPARSGATFLSVNPATGEPWARIADADAADVDAAVAAAARAFRDPAWRGLSATKRGRLLMRLADAMSDNAELLAEAESRENGKLYKEMIAQMRVIPEWLTYYGGLADKLEGRTIPIDKTTVLNYTVREPLGVVGVIKPWNSPMLVTMMAVAPALAAGNTLVIKPSEVTSTSILEVARLADAVGFPPGVFNVVTGAGPAGAALCEHPGVAKIAFTGGSETGKRIAATVGGRLGRYTLELGGKSANIVFADADVDAAEAGVLAGIFAAAGQTCIAGSRALIQEPLFDEIVERVVRRAATIRLGDPLDPETQMGPIATEAQFQKIDGMVRDAVAAGARVRCGGEPAQVDGLAGRFFPPTLLTDVDNSARIAQEEVFGPVLVAIPFRTEEEAVAIANDSRFGLAAGVWTRDVKRAHRVARQLEAGTVWINTYRALSFASPFGGYKESGVGRENGAEAINEYLQTKSVWVELSDEVQDPFVLKV